MNSVIYSGPEQEKRFVSISTTVIMMLSPPCRRFTTALTFASNATKVMLIEKATNATMHVAVVIKFTTRRALGHTVLIAIDILLVRSALICTKERQKLVTRPVQTCIDVKSVGKMCKS